MNTWPPHSWLRRWRKSTTTQGTCWTLELGMALAVLPAKKHRLCFYKHQETHFTINLNFSL